MKSDTDLNPGFEAKWSNEVAVYGFTQIPNLLLCCQGHMKLKDGELITLIHLLTFWFYHGTNVYPSIERLTRFSHKGYSTVQKRLKALEDKEFIKRHHRMGTSNTYEIIPCVQKLYRHQLHCSRLPHSRAAGSSNVLTLPYPLTINKEDQHTKRLNTDNTNIHSQVYGGFLF